MGEDGFRLLDLLQGLDASFPADQLPRAGAPQQVLESHYELLEDGPEGNQLRQVRFKANGELLPAAEGI